MFYMANTQYRQRVLPHVPVLQPLIITIGRVRTMNYVRVLSAQAVSRPESGLVPPPSPPPARGRHNVSE